MSVQVGKTYYVMTHAYHHFIGVLQEITGKREGWFTDVVKVHGSNRGWTQFFEKGPTNEDNIMRFPDGSLSWFAIFEWNHPTPKGK